MGGPALRSAVFGRYWATGGGAEKYGGVIAQLLARSGPVDLLTFDTVDLDWLAERLQLDLSGVEVRVLEDRPGAVTEAGADYDLFVNISFMSSDPAPTPRSVYVVHFPTSPWAHLDIWKRVALRLTALVGRSLPAAVRWGEGFYHQEPGRRGVTWTTGHGRLFITTKPGRSTPIVIRLGDRRPPGLDDVEVVVRADGVQVASGRVGSSRGRVRDRFGRALKLEVRSPARDAEVAVEICSDTFRPVDVGNSDDARTLGVPIQSLRIGNGIMGRLAGRFPILMIRPQPLDWTDTYGVVVANSEFTRHWVRTYWSLDPQVLYPPVTMFEAGPKEQLILNTGRFFPADQGHSKKQLDMVRAFRDLCDRGVEGWTLQLVGGCDADGQGYLDQVRQAAAGYPVEIAVNASGHELADFYARAAIYWHASGLGEPVDRRPDRLEHFGITTVEAMSAGAVPVVIGLAGQLETVRHGVDGYHFATLRELATRTRDLILAPERLAEMSASARARAQEFSIDAFDRRWQSVVVDLGAT
jgi:glycosyltransferase involved in cell wall biosynthesis